MKIETIGAGELDAGLRARWLAHRAADPDLASAFFAPEFFDAIASVRDDVRLALIDGGAGFLPFHARPMGRLAPLGGPVSDYHGVMGAGPGDAGALLRGLGAQAFDFNHALARQTLFAAHAHLITASPLIDLGAGYGAWHAGRRAVSRSFKEAERKARQLARSHGPLRFEPDSRDPAVWAAFLDWKRQSLAAMGVRFVLDRPWARALAETIRATDTPAFAGLTSALWAGDRLVAVHFGMRSDSALHWWFPAFNPDVAQGSPGLELLRATAEHAAAIGLAEVDLGRGSERYKASFASASRPICEGSLARPFTAQGLLRGGARVLRALAQGTRAADLVRRAANRAIGAGRID